MHQLPSKALHLTTRRHDESAAQARRAPNKSGARVVSFMFRCLFPEVAKRIARGSNSRACVQRTRGAHQRRAGDCAFCPSGLSGCAASGRSWAGSRARRAPTSSRAAGGRCAPSACRRRCCAGPGTARAAQAQRIHACLPGMPSQAPAARLGAEALGGKLLQRVSSADGMSSSLGRPPIMMYTVKFASRTHSWEGRTTHSSSPHTAAICPSENGAGALPRTAGL